MLVKFLYLGVTKCVNILVNTPVKGKLAGAKPLASRILLLSMIVTDSGIQDVDCKSLINFTVK